MENAGMKNKFKLLAGISTVLCVLYFIAFGFMLMYYSTAGGAALAFAESFSMFYSQNGFLVVLILVVYILIYTASSKKANAIKVMFWAMLINLVVYVVPFFSSIYLFGNVPAETLLNFMGAYIPLIMLCAVLIALINVWENINKKSVKITALIGVLVTTIFSVILIIMLFSRNITNFGDVCVILTYVIPSVLIVLLCAAIWQTCKTNDTFKQIICEKLQDDVKQKNVIQDEVVSDTKE